MLGSAPFGAVFWFTVRAAFMYLALRAITAPKLGRPGEVGAARPLRQLPPSSESIHDKVAPVGGLGRPHPSNAALAMEAEGGSPTAPTAGKVFVFIHPGRP